MAVVRMRKGKITIPADVRKAANWKDGDTFAVTYDDDGTARVAPSAREDDEHPASDWRHWAARGTATTLSDGQPLQRMTTEQFFEHLDSLAARVDEP